MKKAMILLFAVLLLAGCAAEPAETTVLPETTAIPTTQPETVPATTVLETTVPETTAEPIVTGWQEADGNRYYYDVFGEPVIGWETVDGKIYFFDDTGAMVTGWYQEGEYSYYLQEAGAAVGPQEIDGKQYFFGPSGKNIVLVNPWNKVPKGYQADPVQFEGGYYIGSACHDALKAMFDACRAAGCDPVLISGHRSRSFQEKLFDNKVQKLMDQGYSESGAKKKAAESVAVPGTSEHQLGLAADIIDDSNWSLDETQADNPTQQWLMEHCWEYGFILRYPEGTTEITGIIYEPWHYRYVGVEAALEIKALGITLEEYLDAVHE